MKMDYLQDKSNVRKIVFFVGLTIGGVIFLWQLVKTIFELSNRLLTIKFSPYFILAFFILLCVRFFQIMNWHNLMKGIGHSLPFKDVFANYSLLLLPKYIPGGVWGYLSRGEWLYKYFQIGYGSSNFISATEIILVVFSSLQIIVLYLYYIKHYIHLALAIIIILITFISPYIIFRAKKIFFINDKLNKRFRVLINYQPIKFLNYLYSWLLNMLVWVGNGVAIYCFVSSIKSFTFSTLLNYSFIFSSSWLIGFVIFFIPSGIGVREQIMTSLLVNTQMIDPAYSSLISIIMRGSMLLGELIFLCIGILINRFSIAKNTTN